MSHPSRPRARGPAQRRPRTARLESILPLEDRQLLAPFVTVLPQIGDLHRRRRPTATPNLGTVAITNALPSQTGATNALTAFPEAAPLTSVSELTTRLVVRRRHRPDRGRPRRRVRQRHLRHLARGRRQRHASGRDQPPGRDLPGRPGDRQVVGLLRPQHGHQPDSTRRRTAAANGLGTADRAGQLVRHHLRPRGLLRRQAVDVRRLGRQRRPEQERDLPDRARRHVPRGVHPVHRQLAERRQADVQPDGDPGPAGRAADATSAACSPRPGRRDHRANGGTAIAATTVDRHVVTSATCRSPPRPPTSRQHPVRGPLLRLEPVHARPADQQHDLPPGVKQTGLTYGIETGLTAANTNYASLVYATFADFGTPAFPPARQPVPGQPGPQRRPGARRRPPDQPGPEPRTSRRRRSVDPDRQRRPLPGHQHRLPPLRRHRLRPVRLLLAGPAGRLDRRHGDPRRGTGTGATTANNGTNTSANGLGLGRDSGLRPAAGSATATPATTPSATPVYAGSLFVADLASGLAVSVTPPHRREHRHPDPRPDPGPRHAARRHLRSTPTATRSSRRRPGRPPARPTRTAPPTAASAAGSSGSTSSAGSRPSPRASTPPTPTTPTSLTGSMLSISFSADGTTLYAADDARDLAVQDHRQPRRLVVRARSSA